MTALNMEFANIFIPAYEGKKIINFEYHPVRRGDQDEDIEQCEPEDAEFWSVYIHYDTAGLDCITDHETEKEAKDFCDFLNMLIGQKQEVATPVKLYSATVEHKHGSNLYQADTEKKLAEKIYGYVREYWNEMLDTEPPKTASLSKMNETIEEYFSEHPTETITYF